MRSLFSKFRATWIDYCIMAAVVVCISVLNVFVVKHFAQLERIHDDALFASESVELDNEAFGNAITQYRPAVYKRIEMYDENLNNVMYLVFDSEEPQFNITQYPDLVEMLTTTEEGQTDIHSDIYNASIYYKWINNQEHGRRLVITYSRIELVTDIWILNLLCSILMLLVAILFFRVHWASYTASINEYQSLVSCRRRQ